MRRMRRKRRKRGGNGGGCLSPNPPTAAPTPLPSHLPQAPPHNTVLTPPASNLPPTPLKKPHPNPKPQPQPTPHRTTPPSPGCQAPATGRGKGGGRARRRFPQPPEPSSSSSSALGEAEGKRGARCPAASPPGQPSILEGAAGARRGSGPAMLRLPPPPPWSTGRGHGGASEAALFFALHPRHG